MSIAWPEKIVALDLETTGTNSTYDYVTMVSAVVMTKDGVQGEPYYTKVRPDMERFRITPSALAVTVGDIRDKEGAKAVAKWLHGLMDTPDAKTVAEGLYKWTQANKTDELPVVAHHAPFDIGFFTEKMRCFRTCFPSIPFAPMWIDTCDMARKVHAGRRGFTLDDCLLREGLAGRDVLHDALQDAIKCGELYFSLVEKLEAGVGE